MRIVLVRPWWGISSYYGLEEGAGPPLGIASIASILEKQGHFVSILDCLGMNLRVKEHIQNMIGKENPDIVGVSISTFNRFQGLEIANIAKELGCIVVVGGVHVTFDFEKALRNIKGIDYIVLGEGEETMQELVEAIDKGKPLDEIKGIAYKKEDEIMVNPPRPFIEDLATLPQPAYHLLPMDNYPYHLIMASRGCPYHCIFCVSPQFWKGKVRFRPYQLVVDEIEYLIIHYGNKYFTFRDDLIFLNKQWCLNFFQEIIKRDLKIKWSVMARTDIHDEEIFRLMKESGCQVVRFGVETGSERIMRIIHKNITKEDVKEAVRLAKNFDLKVGVYFMLGHPTETIKDLEETYKFCCELDTEYYIFGPTSIYPGTALFDLAIKEEVLPNNFNWFDRENIKRYKRGLNTLEGVPTYQTGRFTRKFLEETAKRFYVRRLLGLFSRADSLKELRQILSYRRKNSDEKIKIADIWVIFKETKRELRTKESFRDKIRFLINIFSAYFLKTSFILRLKGTGTRLARQTVPDWLARRCKMS